MSKTAVFLINVGTPEKPEKKAVRKFLSEFLNDPRVIDLPWLPRKLLVNLVILTFRTGKSTKLYRRLWTSKGSPLLLHTLSLSGKLQMLLGAEYEVIPAMRYGKPGLKEQIRKAESAGIDKMIFFPLYPQYASSTTGSTMEAIMDELKTREVLPEFKFIPQFYDHPGFIDSYKSIIQKYDPGKFDHIVFSYHGLPLRQIRKVHPGIDPASCSCNEHMPKHGNKCYLAACHETTRLLANALKLGPSDYTISFQSRLSDDWLSPFTDDTLKKLASEGKKRILIVAPSFVADCLETLVELKEDGAAIFKEAGGEELVLAESLNDSEEWVRTVAEMVS